MQYVLWNTVRVFVCYAVMLIVEKLIYQHLFQWYMAPYQAIYFLVAFVPLPTVSLRRRVVLIIAFMLLTVVARAFDWAIMFGPFEVSSFVSGLVSSSLNSWVSPNCLVFLLTYVFLETRLVRRFCLEESQHVQGQPEHDQDDGAGDGRAHSVFRQ